MSLKMKLSPPVTVLMHGRCYFIKHVTCVTRSFCMEFALESRTPHCTVENRPHTHWMRYIAEGFRVCVACEPPAMRNNSGSCQGDGQESDKYEVRNLLPAEVV